MGILRGIGKGLAGTAAVAGAGAAWAGRGLGFGNTMAAGLVAGGLFKDAADRAFGGSSSSSDDDDDVDISGNVDIAGNLTVEGLSTLNGGTLTLGDAATDAGPGALSIPLDKMSGGISSVLDEIQKEVSLIRNILESQPDPESQEQEKIIEEDARNRRLLAAISSLRLGGPGGGGKKEGFLDKLKSMLGTILGMLGLYFFQMDTLAGWLKNIDEFFENLGVKWAGMAMMASWAKQKIIDFKNKVKDSYRRIKSAFKGFTEKWSSRISRIWRGLTRRLTFITRMWNWVVGLKGRAIAGWSKFIKDMAKWKAGIQTEWNKIKVEWEKVQTRWRNIIKSWDNLKADWRITLAGWRQSFDDWIKTNWTPISEKFAKWKTTFSSWAKKILGWEKSWFGVRAAWGVTSTAVTNAIAGIPEEWKKIKANWISMFEKFTKRVTGLLPKLSTGLIKAMGSGLDFLKGGGARIVSGLSSGAASLRPQPLLPGAQPGAYGQNYGNIDWAKRGVWNGSQWVDDTSRYTKNAQKVQEWIKKFPRLAKWFRVIPYLGGILLTWQAASIMLDEEKSGKEKAVALGALIGSLLGAIAMGKIGFLLGGLVGLAGGPLAAASALVGGAMGIGAGIWGGEWAGRKLMMFLMEMEPPPKERKYRDRPGYAGSFTAERAMQWQQQLQFADPLAGGRDDLQAEIQLLDESIATFSAKPPSRARAEKIEKWKAERTALIIERTKHIDDLWITGMEQTKKQDWYTPEMGKRMWELYEFQKQQYLLQVHSLANPELRQMSVYLTPSIVLNGAGSNNQASTTINENVVILNNNSSSSSENSNQIVHVSASGPRRGDGFYGTSYSGW